MEMKFSPARSPRQCGAWEVMIRGSAELIVGLSITLTSATVSSVTAVRNKHHSVSMSLVEVGSSSNLDAMLSANALRTSLSANDSYLICPRSFLWLKSLSFSQGFQSAENSVVII